LLRFPRALSKHLDPLRSLVVVSVAGLLAFALMQSRIMKDVDWQLHDAQARFLGKTISLDNAVLVDVTDESMRELGDELGGWPYTRDVYAVVTDYLRAARARGITFDITAGDQRPGDDAFATAIARAPNVVLPVLTTDREIEDGVGVPEYLGRFSWRTPTPAPPLYEWKEFLPPRELLLGGAESTVALGVIGVRPDDDGWLRRVPLLHGVKRSARPGHSLASPSRDQPGPEFQYSVLPSLALAALFAGQPKPAIRFDAASQRLHINERSWPVDSEGAVMLRLPRNLARGGKLATRFHFSDVYRAAKAYEKTKIVAANREVTEIEQAIEGKRVFIGSSAFILGDYLNALYRRIPGLAMMAVTTELLDQNEVLSPPRRHWDLALVALALLVPILTFRLGDRSNPLHYIAGFVLTPLLVVGVSGGLYLAGQSTALALPLLAGFFAFVFFLARRLWRLYHERQLLFYEKRAAEDAYQLKSQFISQMTHELRTPLAAIMGFNRLLTESDLADDRYRVQYSKVIDKNSQHLMTLINNMLDQSKFEAGQVKINKAPARIREVVEDVVVTLSPLSTEKRLTLASAFAPDVPPVLEIDAFRVRQVLLNLIGNAIKFTKQGGVTVNVAFKEDVLAIGVRDTGPGISESAMQRIFEPFRQGADDTSQQFGGTGLGLTISRNMCVLMGGALEVRSQLGQGSTFTATLLAARGAEADVPGVAVAEVAAKPQRIQGTILLAEDNSDIRELLTRLLGRMGLTVRIAADGRQAVEAALSESPDVILMDIEMPVLDGVSAAKELRRHGFTAPILAMTAHPEGPEVERALSEGFDGYLEKPVNRDRLHAILISLLASDTRIEIPRAESTA
jgi:signal transduction histidine kinase/CheY-like chemotaxis protein